jgi:nitrite reductase/ring-hydroxylating ferredoxin subunit
MTRALCRIDELKDPGSRAFQFEGQPGNNGFFIVRDGNQLNAWENSCPHARMPLEWMPDEFLDASQTYIVCAAHGALFDMHTGRCVSGPCHGQSLKRVKIELRDETIYLPEKC